MIRNKIKSFIAATLALTVLLSACAKKAADNPALTTENEASVYSVTGGTVDAESTGEVFYTGTVKELSLDSIEAPDGYSIWTRMAMDPVFVGDSVIVEFYDHYDKIEGEPSSDDLYVQQQFAVFDLQGNLKGSFVVGEPADYYTTLFDMDSDGNIVAFTLKYDWDDLTILITKVTPEGKIVAPTSELVSLAYTGIISAKVMEEDRYWICTDSSIMILEADEGGGVNSVSVTDYPANSQCVDIIEENGTFYAELIVFDGYSETSILAQIEQNGSIVMSAGKNADNLIGMRTFQTNQGIYAETMNAFGKLNIGTGEFSQLVDWNQTDVDRSILVSSNIKVVSEGKVTQKISIMDSLDESMSWSQPAPEPEAPEQFSNQNSNTQPQEEQGKTELYLAKTLTEYDYDSATCTPILIHLQQSDENPHADQQVVWIGGVDLASSVITQYVAAYNSDLSNPAWIKMYDYSDFEKVYYGFSDDAKELDAIKAQMNSGVGPDILFGAGDQAVFENSNYLTDLNPYMDSIRGIDRSEYFDNIFETYETNGCLYQLPITYEINACCVNTQLYSGDLDFIDLDKFNMTAGDNLHVMAAYDYTMLTPDIIPTAFSSWIDYSTNSFAVQHDQLVCMVELLGSDNMNYWNAPQIAYWSEELAILNEKPTTLGSYAMGKTAGVDSQWSGVPGPLSDAPSVHATTTLGIASYSVQKEQAWDFIRYMLSEDVQAGICMQTDFTLARYSGLSLPVNRGGFRTLCLDQIDKKDDYVYSVIKDGVVQEVQVEIDQSLIYEYSKLIESAKWRCYYDKEIITIVDEAIYDYKYMGRTADETATTIETKIAQLLHDRQS